MDRLIYSNAQEELMAIRELDRRLLTSSDLRQFLSNVLIGLCELLRVEDGFVLVQSDAGLQVEANVGDAETARRYAASVVAAERWEQYAAEEPMATTAPTFLADTDYWFCPLRTGRRTDARPADAARTHP